MSYDFYFVNYHKAKKQHKCFACRDLIDTGEQYCATVGVYRGDFFYEKLHDKCKRLIDYSLDNSFECEYTYDSIECDLCEEFCRNCQYGYNNDDDCPHEFNVWRCSRIHKKVDEYYKCTKNFFTKPLDKIN